MANWLVILLSSDGVVANRNRLTFCRSSDFASCVFRSICYLCACLLRSSRDRKGLASTHAIPEIFLSALEVAAAVLPLSQDPVVQRQVGPCWDERSILIGYVKRAHFTRQP